MKYISYGTWSTTSFFHPFDTWPTLIDFTLYTFPVVLPQFIRISPCRTAREILTIWVKTEYIYLNPEDVVCLLREGIKNWIEYHNKRRPHQGIAHEIPMTRYEKSAWYAFFCHNTIVFRKKDVLLQHPRKDDCDTLRCCRRNDGASSPIISTQGKDSGSHCLLSVMQMKSA